jgi:hypothetical protein
MPHEMGSGNPMGFHRHSTIKKIASSDNISAKSI